ncbi:hypothetical protein [Streptomyces sp. NPDC005091]
MSDLTYPYVFENEDFVPAGVTVPAAVVKAQADRDVQFDAYGDALLKYDDALHHDFLEQAQLRDAANARTAVLRGESIEDLASEVERVQKLRGFAVGSVQALAAKVQQADRKVYTAWTASLPDVLPEVRESLADADKALREAESAYKAAKFRFRGLVNTLAYVDMLSRGAGKVRSIPGAPKLTGEPGRGWNEHSLSYNFLESHGVEYDEPTLRDSPSDIALETEPVRVRSLVNGVEITVNPGNAASLVASGNAEYVSAEA